MKILFRYEWLLFVRSRARVLTAVFFILTGIYSIYQGTRFRDIQDSTIYSIDTSFQARIQQQIRNFTADTSTKEGKAAYKAAIDPFTNAWHSKAMLWKAPSRLQALAIGQSDTQPFYYGLWVYNDNVYTSKKTELRNPEKLLSGNLDLTYVIIFLLPLMIIVFSYNVSSSDRESGIESIIKAQGISLNNLLLFRLGFRFLLVSGLCIILCCLGFIYSNSFDLSLFISWILISTSYSLFWISVIYALVSLRKTSQVTALLMISAWLFFILLVPSVLNSIYYSKDAERVKLSDIEREFGGHLWGLWQNDPGKLVDTFFSVLPSLKSFESGDSEELKSVAYSYLNMLRLNDYGRLEDNSRIMRQNKLRRFDFFNPAYAAQRALNTLAETESNQFSDFRKQAAEYHLKRTIHLAKFRLSKEPFTIDKMKSYPVFTPAKTLFDPWKTIISIWSLYPVILLSGVVGYFLSQRFQIVK